MLALCTRKRTCALSGPMLRIILPIFSPLTLPPSHPHMRSFTITEDINVPESSSVGHSYCTLLYVLLIWPKYLKCSPLIGSGQNTPVSNLQFAISNVSLF